MRRSARLAEKQTNSKNEAQGEPNSKKSRSDNKITNIATLDNGTMVEAFKFLNYYQLATNSFVSKRFRTLIQTHRHNLVLLVVADIYMEKCVSNHDPVIRMFNEELSPEEYNKWIVRNGYSKQIPLEDQIPEMGSIENAGDIYLYGADITAPVFYARTELKDETWPLFQHFIRLLMDPFIFICTLELNPQKDVLSLLSGAMNPDRNRLQCEQLKIDFNGDTHKFINWIKDHVRCDELQINVNSDWNYDKELLDLFMTGAPCTSAVYIRNYDLSNVIVDFVQKFMDLNSCAEYQVVESIQGYVEDQVIVEALKRDCAEFTAEEKHYEDAEDGVDTKYIFGFINDHIEKKLIISAVHNSSVLWSSFSIKIANL